jgi:sugar phosphate isomerase/epimerase
MSGDQAAPQESGEGARGGGWSAVPAANGATPADSRPRPVQVGLSTASAYPMSCADAFAMAGRIGYDGVEVMVWNDSLSQDVAALARLSDHYSVPILAIHAPCLLITQRVWGRDPWAKLERSCWMAKELGARTVVVHPPFRWQKDYAATFVEGVAELIEKTGVAIAVENMYPWRASKSRSVLAYLPGHDPTQFPYQYVTLDLSHAATAGDDPLAMTEALGSRLTHLHLADGNGSPKDEHLVPGRGRMPAAEVLNLMAAQNFDGLIVVEVNTRRCRTLAEREADLAECLNFARTHFTPVDEHLVDVERARPKQPEPVADWGAGDFLGDPRMSLPGSDR